MYCSICKTTHLDMLYLSALHCFLIWSLTSTNATYLLAVCNFSIGSTTVGIYGHSAVH